MQILFLLVSFLASVIGAICGIGGGVIIKPTLDLFHLVSVSTISFLSGCTVLAMSSYSVGKVLVTHESRIDFRIGTPLALGAAIGGVIGKVTFSYVKLLFADPNTVGAVQAACLFLITLGTLIYTVKQDSIRSHQIKNLAACIIIGLFLGILSSFLSIGGGPINLVVLFFFFSMDIKTAAQNSLYVILFSQLTSLITTLVTNSVPEFNHISLMLMVSGGILGGIVGQAINKRIDNRTVSKLFTALMAVIIMICAYNIVQYA